MNIRSLWGMPCVALVLLAGLGSARAEIVILGSSDPEAVAIGTILSDDKMLEVPKGVSVRVMSASGRTEVISGPATRPVSELSGKGEVNKELWQSVTAKLKPAKTRGMSKFSIDNAMPGPPGAPTLAYTFAWDAVPVFAKGDVCVDGGAKLSLLRGGLGKPERIVVQEMQGDKRRAEVTFADGKSRVSWPGDLQPRTGIYVFQAEGREPVKITLRLVSPRPNSEDVLRVLTSQRCEYQRDALIDALRDPSFQVSSLDR